MMQLLLALSEMESKVRVMWQSNSIKGSRVTRHKNGTTTTNNSRSGGLLS